MARNWTPRETRLVSEWAVRTFPGAELRFRVALGSLTPALGTAGLSAAELRLLGRGRRWVDCLAITPDALHLIEAKIRLVPGALEQLGLYTRLLPLTPELAEYRDRAVVQHLVYAIEDPVLVSMARERGVLVHIFRPPWVDDYIHELHHNERRPPQARGLLDLGLPSEEREA